jgi:hypothetical protein
MYNNNRKWANKPEQHWKLLADNQRQLPCHPSVRVRIKIIEPGVQERWCNRCGQHKHFELQPTSTVGLLKLRWFTPQQSNQWIQKQEP